MGVRNLRAAEVVAAEAAAIRDGADVLTLPPGIASNEDFFDAACRVFPLNPSLAGRGENNWEALSAALVAGLSELDARSVVVVWPDAWLLTDRDREAGRIATEILSALPGKLATLEAAAGRTKVVTVILGTRGV